MKYIFPLGEEDKKSSSIIMQIIMDTYSAYLTIPIHNSTPKWGAFFQGFTTSSYAILLRSC